MQAVVGLALARRPQDGGAVGAGGVFGELGARVALVADDRLAAAQRHAKQAPGDITLLLVSRGEDDRADRAVWRAEQVQPHPPKPARVTAAVVVCAGDAQL